MSGPFGLDGAFDVYYEATNTNNVVDQIRDALAATYDPGISNETRQQALQFLDHVKLMPNAPQHGYNLAEDWRQNDAVRYYGLQILEYTIRYRWTECGLAQTQQLREWTRSLAGSLRKQDPLFIRNKVAQLWVEVAKRCWGDEWMDMDQQLVNLWQTSVGVKGTVNFVFVLYVLETLSEDIINNEDPAAGLRMEVLGAALHEIMVPRYVYEDVVRTRGDRQEVRCDGEGWLARIAEFLVLLINQVTREGDVDTASELSACAIKALDALRPTLVWITIRAALTVDLVPSLFLPFDTEDVALQTAATETLYVLLCRPYNGNEQTAWVKLTQQALHHDRIGTIRQIFEGTSCGPGEEDESYRLLKKLSELLSVLSDDVALHPELLACDSVDVPAFFDFLVVVVQSKSLAVSLPVLHSWSKLMGVQATTVIDMVLRALQPLVQTCSERLLRYEELPPDSEDDVVRFLDVDSDTIPERHAFLGNYRRYCVSILTAIGRTRPLEAMQHVLGQMRLMLENGPYTGGRGFTSDGYTKNSLPALQFDAQFNVVSSVLKGYSMWCLDTQALPHEDPLFARAGSDRATAEDALQEWSSGVINLHVDDPDVAAKVLHTLVAVVKTVKPSSEFVLKVVQHLLTMRLYDNPGHAAFSDAVRVFEGQRVMELQRLALAFSSELLEVYHELEPRIGVLIEKHNEDPKLVWSYRGFLFMIIHRAPHLEHDARIGRLQQMLQPIQLAWEKYKSSSSLSSFEDFCQSLGLGNLAEFQKAYRFDEVSDWSAQQLDLDGIARQQVIKDRIERIPLRMTRAMLSVTVERLHADTEEFINARAVWRDLILTILPSVLQTLRYAVAFHDMKNWSHLSPELQAVMKRTLQDRFWQSGISNESKDEFYARISGSKTSYEGFASTVRSTMRIVRDQGYHIIFMLTKFEDDLYGIPNVAEGLADNLFSEVEALPANHLHPLIDLTIRLVMRCPGQYRTTVLPPLLKALLTRLDNKITSEWAAIDAATNFDARDEDDLGNEMRAESILRQLAYSMVCFVQSLLEIQPTPADVTNGTNGTDAAPHPKIRDIVLQDPSILEPMLVFCNHVLRMRDTRCCTAICRVFRSVVPFFQADTLPMPEVREFICTEVLKACITSLHEPYFADMQKDLAALIANIILLYSRRTSTLRNVLLSLPGMTQHKVERTIEDISRVPSERKQRALVLGLLEDLRAVSIHEAGKIARPPPPQGIRRGEGGQQAYMQIEQRPAITNGEETGLEDVAGLFGD
ncbi:hypothetical protein BAUCODRAFT_367095 [Baudoinia panamericana UAMH 10762]|uniref:Exportin-5 C-terminal domain-containing protein n=1 Tax=Baudoinia panamericana (strain UAMH 10762) TaxID=717646 RepID=M2N7S8_BAUPA|nr:uncharacterized protein BAUCODRAFT_367095 [Baudoinia panamericana UAMH 10762]EMD00164.1 hypothetical protein BAUCODRAFT_367095 [Baudoinia panamericana UAMH 10762]